MSKSKSKTTASSRRRTAKRSSLGEEMAAGLGAFCDAIEAGEPIAQRYTVRTVQLELTPGAYGPEDVKALRARLGGSQPLFARFLGVSVKTVRSWEQGSRPVPPIARRFMDELVAHPELWSQRIQVVSAGL